MPLYINEDDPIFPLILEYRRAKEDMLKAAARGDVIPVDTVNTVRLAAIAAAEMLDKETRR